MNDTPIPVIYIMGSARCGSTVLDIVLGGHPSVGSYGELAELPRLGWIGNEYDSSGVRCNEAPFWNEVKSIWLRNTGLPDVEHYLAMQKTFERVRSILRLWRERIFPSDEFRNYALCTTALYAAIVEASGKPIVVDSSKYPARVFALSMVPGIRLFPLLLARDGRGVVWSMKRPYHKDEKGGVGGDLPSLPAWRTALIWMSIYLMSLWTIKRTLGIKPVLIRYEDFVSNPRQSLTTIGDFIGIDYAKMAGMLERGEEFQPIHTVAGNRVRMSGKIRLQLDEEWKTSLTTKDLKIFWLLAGWLMRRFGYDK